MKLLPLFGILVAHLFTINNAAFSQSVLHRTPFLNRVINVSLERGFYVQKNLGKFGLNKYVFLTTGLFRAFNMLIL